MSQIYLATMHHPHDPRPEARHIYDLWVELVNNSENGFVDTTNYDKVGPLQWCLLVYKHL